MSHYAEMNRLTILELSHYTELMWLVLSMKLELKLKHKYDTETEIETEKYFIT